jgi:hypothetical protein
LSSLPTRSRPILAKAALFGLLPAYIDARFDAVDGASTICATYGARNCAVSRKFSMQRLKRSEETRR